MVVLVFVVGLIGGNLAHANVVGSDFQSFNPTSDGLSFVTVEAAQTIPSGHLGVGGFFDYAYDTLPPALGPTNQKYSVHDRILSGELHFVLGILKNWEVGLNLSSILSSSLESGQEPIFFQNTGVTDFRLNSKYRLLGEESRGGLAINLTMDYPRLGNDPFYGNVGNSNSYDAELIWHRVWGVWQWAVNGGYRFRNVGAPIVNASYEPVGSEILASTALSYFIMGTNLRVIGELFGARPVSGTAHYSVDEMTNLEALLGVKYFGFKNFALHTGVTTEVMRGTSSPDFRIYAGLTWYPFQLWDTSAPTKVAQAPEPKPPPRPSKPVVTESSASDTSVFDKEPEEKVEHFVVRDLNFDTGSAVVSESFAPYLAKLTEYLRRGRPLKRLTIYGHTDNQGSALYNQGLSQRRAESVKAALVSRYGIPADKIETIGMGLSSPVASNDSTVGRSLNRRVEFKIEREDLD